MENKHCYIPNCIENNWSRKTILMLVKHFNKQNMISDDELNKYYLDETGTYIPKLKTT